MGKLVVPDSYSVREQYGDAVPEEKHVEKQAWNLSKKEVSEALSEILQFSRSQLGRQVQLTFLKDPTVICSATTEYDLKGRIDMMEVELRRQNNGKTGEKISHFRLMRSYKREWDLRHRIVHREYTGNGIFSASIDAIEEAVRIAAEHNIAKGQKRKDHRIVVDLGQPSVLARFLRKGYAPNCACDEQVAEEMLLGSPELFCDYAYEPGGCSHNPVYEPDATKSLYAFRKGTTDGVKDLNEYNAVRVKLFKKIKIS